MNGDRQFNEELLQGLCGKIQGNEVAQTVVCPPHVYLPQVSELLRGSGIEFGAQDVSAEEAGAFTGEVSAAMLSDLGCSYVIVGHSERRAMHGESPELVACKALKALEHQLVPIVCVGETLEQRVIGDTLKVVGEQLHAVLARVATAQFANMVVSYEPVWAIGTGLTATPEQAQEVHGFIRSQLGAGAEEVRLLYGGSVNSGNAESLLAESDIDGALVGGASLKYEDFYTICQTAVR